MRTPSGLRLAPGLQAAILFIDGRGITLQLRLAPGLQAAILAGRKSANGSPLRLAPGLQAAILDHAPPAEPLVTAGPRSPSGYTVSEIDRSPSRLRLAPGLQAAILRAGLRGYGWPPVSKRLYCGCGTAGTSSSYGWPPVSKRLYCPANSIRQARGYGWPRSPSGYTRARQRQRREGVTAGPRSPSGYTSPCPTRIPMRYGWPPVSKRLYSRRARQCGLFAAGPRSPSGYTDWQEAASEIRLRLAPGLQAAILRCCSAGHS